VKSAVPGWPSDRWYDRRARRPAARP